MQVNKLACAGEGFEMVWRKADLFLPYTTHKVWWKQWCPRVMQSRFWVLDGVLDFAGLDFHTNFLIRELPLEGLRSFKVSTH